MRSLVVEGPEAIEAWVATVADAHLRAHGETLAAQALLHNEVVNAALATGRTPAPARYGSRFADDATCLADLGRRSRELAAVLRQVADAIEIGVLLVPTADAAPRAPQPTSREPSAGRRYLESLRMRTREDERRRAAAEAEVSRIDSLVHDLIRASHRGSASSLTTAIAHLVGWGSLAEYRARLRSFKPIGPFRLVLGDPRAPYSFTSPKPGRTGHDSGSPNRSD